MLLIEKIKIPVPYPIRSVNCFFINGPVPTLIDAGINTPQARRKLHTELIRLGSGLEKIRRIIITHGHLDHAGLAGWMAVHHKAKIFISALDHPKLTIPHEAGAEAMQQRYFSFLSNAGVEKQIIIKIIRKLMLRRQTFVHPISKVTYMQNGNEFDCNGHSLKVIATPGHTPGAMCLFAPQYGILFSGDTLLSAITPNPVIELDNPIFEDIYPSLRNYLQSLDRLKGLLVKTIYPGHGKVFEGHIHRIIQIQEHIQRRKQQVLKILKKLENEKGVLLLDIAGRLFPTLKRNQVFLALSESVAHLEYLKEEGRVYSEIHQKCLYYHTKDDI